MKKIEVVKNAKLIGTLKYGNYTIYAIENDYITTLWIGSLDKCIMSTFSFASKGFTPQEIEKELNKCLGTIDEFINEYNRGVEMYLK